VYAKSGNPFKDIFGREEQKFELSNRAWTPAFIRA